AYLRVSRITKVLGRPSASAHALARRTGLASRRADGLYLIGGWGLVADRKSTRLNSSHEWISYAVFCLKKKKRTKCRPQIRQTSPVITTNSRIETRTLRSADLT